MYTLIANKHRIGFQYNLLSKQKFIFQDEIVSGVAVDVCYRIFNLQGEELFFNIHQIETQCFNFDGIAYSIQDIIHCHYHNQKIVFERNPFFFSVLANYVLTYDTVAYYQVTGKNKLERVPIEKFNAILNEMSLYLNEHNPIPLYSNKVLVETL